MYLCVFLCVLFAFLRAFGNCGQALCVRVYAAACVHVFVHVYLCVYLSVCVCAVVCFVFCALPLMYVQYAQSVSMEGNDLVAQSDVCVLLVCVYV